LQRHVSNACPTHAPATGADEGGGLSARWAEPQGAPALAENEVHVWRVGLDGAAPAGVLSDDERQRAARFRFERDRRRFAAARASLREILGGYLGEPPERLRFGQGAHGKPVLAWPAASGVCFNVSHSDALALCAVSRGREVGVDVEALRPLPDADALAERFFSAAELAELRRLPDARRLQAFFCCWTRKEAYLKAIGCGLLQPLDAFDVSVAPEDLDCRLSVPAQPAEAARWLLLSLDAGPGYAAAVAGSDRPWQPVRWTRREVPRREPVTS
jgi:4'-phosphopantetheinyl transferase